LWIDHRKAVIVFITDKKIEKKTITSNGEKQPGRIDGVRSTASYESLLVHADDSRQRDFTGHLNIYFNSFLVRIKLLKIYASISRFIRKLLIFWELPQFILVLIYGRF
jgi:hypothetical protein